jgi:phospholipid/cholesterol/gamma-HCH transport system substrate-binding protein
MPRRKARKTRAAVRPLIGLLTITAVGAVVLLCASLFRGAFTPSVPVTVLSPRAGLVMDPDAKVKMLGVEVGRVGAIESRPDGQAALHLAINPEQLKLIPSNVAVEIASTTVFGAKYVQLVPPPDPSTQSLRAGQVISARRVTVEVNTLFERLTSLLSSVDPGKLNATLAALSSALNGRGHQIGQTFADLDALLARIEPSLPSLEHDIKTAPQVVNAYAEAAPDLLTAIANTTRTGTTLVEQQGDLDAVLMSAAGLGEIGADVVGTNRQALTDVLRLLVPTTDVTNRYRDGIHCGLAGFIPVAESPPSPVPGVVASLSFELGVERYRYPSNLPKVAATGDPHCTDIGLPDMPYQFKPKFVVADVGANPWQFGNQGIVLNSDGLKQLLFGSIDGPPRNTAQIGQPG